MYACRALQIHIPSKLGNDIMSLTWSLQSLEQKRKREQRKKDLAAAVACFWLLNHKLKGLHIGLAKERLLLLKIEPLAF